MSRDLMLISYPDSLGGDLKGLRETMDHVFEGAFTGVHILPPFPSTGDRGFAPTDYLKIDSAFGGWEDIRNIASRYAICLDLMVNHVSRESEHFKDYLQKGDASRYKDCFITLDKLWADGEPRQEDIDKMFLRRQTPYSTYNIAGKDTRVWTTFGKTEQSQQVDIDVSSPVVEQMFEEIFSNFASSGVKLVRLDAVGYVTKKAGTSCFFVEPQISRFLDGMKRLADGNSLTLLPEVHAQSEIQNRLVEKDFWIYDFILPFMTLEALLTGDGSHLFAYIRKRPANQFTTLDCHDGIPVKPDLDGYVSTERARRVVDICMERGGNLSLIISHKHQNEDGFNVHQIRGTYYSLLGGDDDAYFAARVIQLFVPGIPQVYYVGALAGGNDTARGARTGDGREVNRHNYTAAELAEERQRPIVGRLLELFKLRSSNPAFDGEFACDYRNNTLELTWTGGGCSCSAAVNFDTMQSRITVNNNESGSNFCQGCSSLDNQMHINASVFNKY